MKSSSASKIRKSSSGGRAGETAALGGMHLSTLILAGLLCIVVTLYHLHSLGRFQAPRTLSRHPSEVRHDTFSSVVKAVARRSTLSLNDTLVMPHTPYKPIWKRWKHHMFHALDDDLVAEGNCVGWRQTMLCSPHGPVEPYFSKSCDARITSGSGYCMCKKGIRAKQVGCGNWDFTCRDACGLPATEKLEVGGRNTIIPSGGNTLEDLQSKGMDIKRRLLAQRSLMSLIYPSPTSADDHPKEVVSETREEGAIHPKQDVRPGEISSDFLSAAERVAVEKEVVRRQRELVWVSTMREYESWTKEYRAAKMRLETARLGDLVCRGWRSSSTCDPHGPRQPELDRGCGAVIQSSHNGGYCECGSGLSPIYVGCQHRAFTCRQACSPSFDLETLVLPKEEVFSPDGEVVNTRRPESAVSIRREIEMEHISSKEFGHSHLKAVAQARDERERQAEKHRRSQVVPREGEHRAVTEVHSGSGRLRAAIAHALGKSPQQFVTEDLKRDAKNIPRQDVVYRLPDALASKEEEEQYFRYLDHVQSDFGKK